MVIGLETLCEKFILQILDDLLGAYTFFISLGNEPALISVVRHPGPASDSECLFLLSISEPFDLNSAQLQVCCRWNCTQLVAIVFLLQSVQMRIRLVELSQIRILRKLKTGEGHAQLLPHDVVEIPFSREVSPCQ